MKKSILILLSFGNIAEAARPVWTFAPLDPTTLSVPSNSSDVVRYSVTNQSRKTHTLAMHSIQGISQDVSGSYCKNPFTLAYLQSCTLKLDITGSQLAGNVNEGPLVCEQASQGLQCYQPNSHDILNISLTPPIEAATLRISGSPLTLVQRGAAGAITVTNTSLNFTANNVTANLVGTALDGKVTVNANNCTSISPKESCELNFEPHGTIVPPTNFNISGNNTTTVSASISIISATILRRISPSSGSASGGLGVMLIGQGLSDATGVTFDGVEATSVHVLSPTTVTAVTPAHAAGAVNVTITVPSTTATLAAGFTYQTTAVGQAAYGGIIACLNGDPNNLIAAKVDNSIGIEWGGYGSATNATSDTDGATNTTTIVETLDNNGGVPYAAKLCSDFEVDSQGNTPCREGNTCYHDWFLPAVNYDQNAQLNCLYTNQTSIGGFTNSLYWSSTQAPTNPTIGALSLSFAGNGRYTIDDKRNSRNVRCVRAFTP